MAKRPMTEEQKQAARERLAAARAKKAELHKQAEQNQPKVAEAPAVVDHGSDDPTIADLTRQVEELKELVALQQKADPNATLVAALQSLASGSGTQVANGRLVGTTEKYSLDKERYSDPRGRLMSEPKLRRIAFDENYELEFDIGVTQYETKDGLNYKEPKFTLKLNQIILDEMGEPTNRRMGKAQMVFFEDPATAIEVANRLGLPVDETNEREFLDEMRYMRMKEWLFECFWPPRSNSERANAGEMVINGQVVQTWEVSTEGSAKIPFEKLDSKLRA